MSLNFPFFWRRVADLYAIARPVIVNGKAYAIAVIGRGKRIEDNQQRLFAALEKACKAVAEPVPRPQA